MTWTQSVDFNKLYLFAIKVPPFNFQINQKYRIFNLAYYFNNNMILIDS